MNEYRQIYLNNLYERIPKINVCEGAECDGDCCKVPFIVSEYEKNLLPGNNFSEAGKCNFLENGRCSVYEKRPMVCRMFGINELRCGRVEKKDVLSKENAMEIILDYMTLFFNYEECKKYQDLTTSYLKSGVLI